jgi:hypothetical protein
MPNHQNDRATNCADRDAANMLHQSVLEFLVVVQYHGSSVNIACPSVRATDLEKVKKLLCADRLRRVSQKA